MIQAQSADGVMHEFPDGTDPSVVDRVMKGYAQQQSGAERRPEARPADRASRSCAKSDEARMAVPPTDEHRAGSSAAPPTRCGRGATLGPGG